MTEDLTMTAEHGDPHPRRDDVEPGADSGVDAAAASSPDGGAATESPAVAESTAEPADTPEAEVASMATNSRGPASALLEREGDVAADYLEALLDIADRDGDIDIDIEGGRAMVSIVEANAGDLGDLVGDNGVVLEALQDLSRLAATRETGERSRLMLDIAGFRAARRTALEAVATTAIAEARRRGEPVTMDPMTPFERKVVHDTVAAAGMTSESHGESPNRRVVIRPA